MRRRVTRGRVLASFGKSHSCETPTTSSINPSAAAISVAAGTRDTIRLTNNYFSNARNGSPPPIGFTMDRGGDRILCGYGACGVCPSVKSPVAEVSGEVASAALFLESLSLHKGMEVTCLHGQMQGRFRA